MVTIGSLSAVLDHPRLAQFHLHQLYKFSAISHRIITLQTQPTTDSADLGTENAADADNLEEWQLAALSANMRSALEQASGLDTRLIDWLWNELLRDLCNCL